MLPTQAAIISAQISAASNAATHAAVQASLGMFRNAAVLELADRSLGELNERIILALGAQTKARRILISAERHRHAISQRKIATELDANLVASRLTEALQNLKFQLVPQRRRDVFEVVGYAHSASRYILLALKLVLAERATTGKDEWWVRTAHPMGQRNLRLACIRNRLLDLNPEPMASNNSFESDAAKPRTSADR